MRLSEVSVTVTGPGANERAIREVIEAQELKPGLRLNHGTYERVKGTLLRAAKNEGYLDARLTKNDLVIDRVERRANVTIEADTGKRYSYGEIKIAQDVINDEAMRRLLRMKHGDPYTLDSLLRTQYVLDDSQYFSSVNIESGDPDREALTVPVTVTAGAEPQASLRRQPGLRHGHRGARQVHLGQPPRESRAATGSSWSCWARPSSRSWPRYVIPVMDIALEKLEFTGNLREEEIGDTESQRNEVGAGLTQVQGRWQRVLFVRLSNETTTEGDGLAQAPPSTSFRGSAIRRCPATSSAAKRGRIGCISSCAARRPRSVRRLVPAVPFPGRTRCSTFAQRWHLDLRASLA